MPANAETDLSALKSRVDLLELIQSDGVLLARSGREFRGLCPFHTESKASFYVNPQKGLFHCFGCGESGDVLDYLQKRTNLDFTSALARLRSLAGEAGDGRAEIFSAAGEDSGPHLEPVVSPLLDGIIQNRVKEVFRRYETLFAKSPSAREYLLSRGISGADVVEKFSIGYCDGKLQSVLPPARSEEGTEIRAALSASGILNVRGREHFSGCIVFAVRDEDDVIRQIYGRRISGGTGHLYLPGPHGIFFNPHALKQESLILCEGLFDALSFWMQGHRNVSFTYGTNGLTSVLLDTLRSSNVKHVCIAFDGDGAGDEGALRLSERFLASGIAVSRPVFPEGTDPNELHVKGESLALYLKRALEMEVHVKADDAGQRHGKEPAVTDETPADAGVRAGAGVGFTYGDRTYRVDGLVKNRSPGSLSVTIHAQSGDGLFIERIELYSSKERDKFVRMCAREFGGEEDVIRRDLSGIIKSLRQMQDRMIESDLAPKGREAVVIPAARMSRALEFLRTPDFRARFSRHARTLGLVGEDENFELGFYITISRILSKPLHGKVKSASAAGKSTLLDVLSRICPSESLLRLSALSAQALYYMEDLSHRLIVLEEDAGMEYAMYPLKILQTEGVLRKGTVFRDPDTGKSAALEIEAKGPVASLVASTSTLESEEEDNRYLILSMNETREQTEAILAYQRELETVDRDELDSEAASVSELYQDALRLIQNRPVINPYATRLLFVIRRHRFRRDQPKLLRLIRLITLSCQYQRNTYHETKHGATKEYLLSTVEDNVLAVRLAGHALEKSLDEMGPHTRHFLEQFRELVQEMSRQSGTEKRFCRPLRRDLSRHTGLSASTVHAHLQALHRLDYIVFHKDEKKRDRVELVDDELPLDGWGMPEPEALSRDLLKWEEELRTKAPGRRDFWRTGV